MSDLSIFSLIFIIWSDSPQSTILTNTHKHVHHHHHHLVPSARISLSLFRHPSLSFIASGRSSGDTPRIYTELLYIGSRVKGSMISSLMSSSLLFQQCPTYLVRLTLIVFVMGGRWPYSSCFVGCCLQDLFNIARSILVYKHVYA